MLTIDVLIKVANAVVIALEFAVTVCCSGNVLSDGVVDLWMDTLAGSMFGVVIISGLSGIGVDVLVDVNVNVFAGVMTVKFAMPTPLEGFGCRAAFDCRPMAALNCDHVLQAWMPPYQV